MTPLSLPEAYRLLSSLSGWAERDVQRDPTSAAEYAAKRCIEARNLIREMNAANDASEQQRRRDGAR